MTDRNDRASWLQAGSARCSVPPEMKGRPRRLVLLGAPGVGKGTMAELLCEQFGTCHLSTGDVIRAARHLAPCDCSPALTQALESMRRGELVSDETVLDLVRERVRCLECCGGFLLDGFPRTLVQAEALERILAEHQLRLDAVLNYELDPERIVARLGGRRTCSQCKAVFHVEGRPPRKEGVCDHCGGALVQREDDRPEAVRVRMAAYEQLTRPLVEYYQRKGQLLTVPAEGDARTVFKRTLEALDCSA